MIVSFVSGKGGIGKSMIAANVAYGLAKNLPDKDVILISADVSARTSELLISSFEKKYGWIEYLKSNLLPEEILAPSNLLDNLYIVYSSKNSLTLHGEFPDHMIPHVARKILMFKNFFKDKIIIIDAPAGKTKDHALYCLYFEPVLVTTPMDADLEGTKLFKKAIENRARMIGIKSNVWKGVIINKVVKPREEILKVVQALNITNVIGWVPADRCLEKISGIHYDRCQRLREYFDRIIENLFNVKLKKKKSFSLFDMIRKFYNFKSKKI